MTPDQNELVQRLHLEVGGAPFDRMVTVRAGDIVRLINFLRMEERAAFVAQQRCNTVLARAAEWNCEELLIGANHAPLPPRTATAVSLPSGAAAAT
jgi:hypothetical protein